jgi:Glutathione S-transferase, N-terminal domain
MKPILYFDNISPPVRSVLLLIEALNIDVDYRFVDLFAQEHLAEDYVKVTEDRKIQTWYTKRLTSEITHQLNPLHTVPTLKHDDLILTDSHAILFYLCDVYGDSTIFELKNPVLRGKVLNRLMFNSSVLFQRDKEVMVRTKGCHLWFISTVFTFESVDGNIPKECHQRGRAYGKDLRGLSVHGNIFGEHKIHSWWKCEWREESKN